MNAGIRSKISSKELKLSEYMKIAEILNKFAMNYPIDAESYHTWIILYFQKYSKMEAWTSKPDQQLLDTTNVTRIALKRLNKVIILTCILVWWALTRFMLLEMSPNVWIIVIYICISLLIEYKNNNKFKIISCEQINFQYVNYWLYL